MNRHIIVILVLGAILVGGLFLLLSKGPSPPPPPPSPPTPPPPPPPPQPQDCVVEWKEWSTCNPPCGGPGTQQRTYDIITPPLYGGKACPAEPETQACDGGFCPGQASLYGKKVSFGLPIVLKTFTGGVEACPTWGYTIAFWVQIAAPQTNMLIANLIGPGNKWSCYSTPSSATTLSSFGGQWNNPDITDVDFTKPVCIVLSGSCQVVGGNAPFVTHYVSVNNRPPVTNGTNQPNWRDNNYAPPIFFFNTSARVQEFRQWNKSLSPSEITEFYNNGIVTKEPISPSNTILCYHLDEGSGNQVTEAISGTKYAITGTTFGWAPPIGFD
jgi:hypothetical protein